MRVSTPVGGPTGSLTISVEVGLRGEISSFPDNPKGGRHGVPPMHWVRRRDLEGGKELGVWLLVDDDGAVERELYVESHRYRGGDFDVYTATPAGEWEHVGEFETRRIAFDRARRVIDESPHALEPGAG